MSNHWKDVDRETRQGAPRVLLIAVLSVLGVLLLVGIVVGIRYITADFRGAADQREKTVASGSYRIGSYDSFYDQCEQIRAKEAIIKNFEEQKAAATTPKEKQDAQININAVTNTRTTMIAKYNADSSKAGTKALFKGDDLPYKISEEGETQCAA